MMRKGKLLLLLLLLSAGLRAQNLSDLIISEAMPGNPSSVTDEYGEHADWIELFNTSEGTVNFGGCFLTDDPSDLTKCQITKDDRSTRLGPRQVTLLFADGDSTRGTYHLNFTLPRGGTVYLVSNDGRTIIDSIEIPADLPEGMSISKFAHDNKELEFNDVHPSVPSPRSLNGKHNQKTRAQVMKETDPHGWTLTLISVSVVFAALFILFLIYNLSGIIFSGKYKRNRKSRMPDDETAAAVAMALRLHCADDAVPAAIAMALHMHLGAGVHDFEPGIITIKQAGMSAWNDKKLLFRRSPDKL